jgi:hypothetical protein
MDGSDLNIKRIEAEYGEPIKDGGMTVTIGAMP